MFPAAPEPSVVNGRTITSLTVVAGPAAVGKTRLLKLLATDERLRERLRMPKAPAVHPKELIKLGSSGPINELILHYDILRPHYRAFDSHAADPVMSTLGQVETVAFFTLKTTPECLSAQLAGRIATGGKRLRWLQELYQDEGFIVDWYERWFRFVQRFRAGTTVHYIVDADRGYQLTKVT